MEAFNKKIYYPDSLKKRGVSGLVTLRILIDENGTYMKGEYIIIKNPHPVLTDIVLAAIPTLTFSPAEKNGKPVKEWVYVPVDFKLRKK